jgi:hypothetical protein
VPLGITLSRRARWLRRGLIALGMALVILIVAALLFVLPSLDQFM